MGGTLSSIYSNISYALHSHMDAMIRLQEQAATGSRINRVSDAPGDAYRLLGLLRPAQPSGLFEKDSRYNACAAILL